MPYAENYAIVLSRCADAGLTGSRDGETHVKRDEGGPMSADEQSLLHLHTESHRDVPVRGDFRCMDCGYGVSVVRALPHCPMCGASAWEPAPRLRVRRFHLAHDADAVPPAVVSGRRAVV
jgi:lipopolysaccharide biosynthesis regulator YciM